MGLLSEIRGGKQATNEHRKDTRGVIRKLINIEWGDGMGLGNGKARTWVGSGPPLVESTAEKHGDGPIINTPKCGD